MNSLNGKFDVNQIIENYNFNTTHSGIGRTPASVYIDGEEPDIPHERNEEEKVVYVPGDKVRILAERHGFDKRSKHNWSKEIFTIETMVQRDNILGYKLKDVDGLFYSNELKKPLLL